MVSKTSLQLGKITLKNYRTYQGEATIELSRDSKKTITIIEGTMGKGKTTILNAIYWCLYGKFRSTGTHSDENIINNYTLLSLKPGLDDDTFVEISLYEEDKLRYKIKRSIRFSKTQESSRLDFRQDVDGNLPDGIEITPEIEFSHLQSTTNEWRVETDPVLANDLVQNVFPESLSSYFLFDAELLDSFLDLGSKNTVKDGIEKISGLPVIEDAIKHMKKTHSEIFKDIKSPKTEPIKEDIFILEKKIESNNQTISVKSQRLQEIDAERESIRSYLRNNDEKAVREKQERADSIRIRIKGIREELSGHNKTMSDWLLYCNTVSRLRDSMEKSLRMCNKWEQDGEIPIAVSGQALKNILKANPSKCICGTHLAKGSEERRYMERLLAKNTADSPLIQNITTGRGHWDDMVNEVEHSNLTKQINEHRSMRDESNSELDKQSANLKEISDQLKKHDQEQIRIKSSRLHELDEEYNENISDKAVAEEKVRKATLGFEEKDRELKKLAREEDKYHSYYNRHELAETVEKILVQCRDNIIGQLRTTVAEKTTEYFLRLVSRMDFSKVEISQDYTVTAYGPTEHSKGLSAGQTCCLALSYIAAIRDIAEKNYFMMIDSPLHNIDQRERVDIAKNLPNFTPGTQITLLVQDQEYVGRVVQTENRPGIQSVRDTLRDNNSLWKEYKLTFHENPETNSYNTVIEELED